MAKIDTAKIRRNWEDILRVVASIYTGTVRAYDMVTMLQRELYHRYERGLENQLGALGLVAGQKPSFLTDAACARLPGRPRLTLACRACEFR